MLMRRCYLHENRLGRRLTATPEPPAKTLYTPTYIEEQGREAQKGDEKLMKIEADKTEQQPRCCAPSRCASAGLAAESREMLSVCCDARVCGGRAWEAYIYRCMGCGKHLSLRKHHAGTPQIHWRDSNV